MAREQFWTVSVPYEVHMARTYEMSGGDAYVIVMRTVFMQPAYPCAVYHFSSLDEVSWHMEAYREMLGDGTVMRDMWVSRDLVDVSNGIVNPNDDLGTCLYVIGEIIASGQVVASEAMVAGGRYARTDVGGWFKLEEGRG